MQKEDEAEEVVKDVASVPGVVLVEHRPSEVVKSSSCQVVVLFVPCSWPSSLLPSLLCCPHSSPHPHVGSHLAPLACLPHEPSLLLALDRRRLLHPASLPNGRQRAAPIWATGRLNPNVVHWMDPTSLYCCPAPARHPLVPCLKWGGDEQDADTN